MNFFIFLFEIEKALNMKPILAPFARPLYVMTKPIGSN